MKSGQWRSEYVVDNNLFRTEEKAKLARDKMEAILKEMTDVEE